MCNFENCERESSLSMEREGVDYLWDSSNGSQVVSCGYNHETS